MNKLKSINIINYKCFERVSFRIKDINIMIGENNAGKSTAIEAIKLLSFAIDRIKLGRFTDCPSEISDNKKDRCVYLNIENLLIDISLASHKYNGQPSKITGYFDNNLKVIVYVIKKEVYAIAYNKDDCITNRRGINEAAMPSIYVMPHFNLLRGTETLIDERRTRGDRFNYRSSLHFRNELIEYKDLQPQLNELLNNTWHGLQLNVYFTMGVDEVIDTQVRDKDFSIDITNYGSGLQMWLQMLWFLCKVSEEECIVVLDEPDVYIHADLQRKLYHLVVDKYSQIIIATHSIEIINESKLSNIMIVDKTQKVFKFCKEKLNLEVALKVIGTTQNLMLTKLQRYNKCLFVEGTDLDILDDIFRVAINDKSKSIKDFATCRLDGKSNYKESFGAAKIFREDSDGTFRTFCLLDKDYNESFNSQIKEEAEKSGIILHILDRLEIENYLLVPRIYARIINRPLAEVEEKLKDIADSLRGETLDRVLQEKILEYKKVDPQKNVASISQEARELIANAWGSLDGILSIVPGKEMKAKIFDWIKAEYKISCSNKLVLRNMELSDIPGDLVNFLKDMSK